MTSDPTQPDGSADEPLNREPPEAIDETETAGPRATPVSAKIAIEGYEIIRELHRGGQGIVFEAVQKSTKRKVAIKVLLEGRFASSSARQRFQREITLAAERPWRYRKPWAGHSHPLLQPGIDAGAAGTLAPFEPVIQTTPASPQKPHFQAATRDFHCLAVGITTETRRRRYDIPTQTG